MGSPILTQPLKKPCLIIFHRQGNETLDWTEEYSFDDVAANYVVSDWVGVDPYIYPKSGGTTEHPLSMISQDADWALLSGEPWVMVGYGCPEAHISARAGCLPSIDKGSDFSDSEKSNQALFDPRHALRAQHRPINRDIMLIIR